MTPKHYIGNTDRYVPPINGSFYVPPKYQRLIGMLGPTAGDFARGSRTVPVLCIDATNRLVYIP